MYRFATEFYQDSVNEWRWRTVADNGEIVGAATEGFINRHDCVANFKTLLSYMQRDILAATPTISFPEAASPKEPGLGTGQAPFGLPSPSSVPSSP